MRFIVRWLFRSCILLIVLAVAAVLLKDILVKEFLARRIQSATGMEFKCAGLEVGLLSPTLDVDGLKLYRPPQLGGVLFADVPELHLECDPVALALWRLHIKLARVSVNELNVMEEPERLGRIGANAASPGTVLSGFNFTGIDTLNLSFGKLTYTSPSRPGKRTQVEVGLTNQIVSNVRSVADLTNLVMQAALRHGLTISDEPVTRSKHHK